MSRFRIRKLEELRGYGKTLFGQLGPPEERLHDLRGYLVADGRMGPFAVVIGLDELDHGVVVAVSGAAAGNAHVVGARPLGERPAGVLGTPIRTKPKTV